MLLVSMNEAGNEHCPRAVFTNVGGRVGLPVGIHVSPTPVGLSVGAAVADADFVNTQLCEDVFSAAELHSLNEPRLSHLES